MEEWRCRQFGPDKQQQWKIELLTELIQICLPNNFIFDLIIHPQHCNDRARCRVWPAGDSHICKVSLDDDSSLMRIIFEEFLGPKMCFFLLQAWWRWLDHQWVKDLHHKWVQSTKSYNALSSIIIIICKSLNKKLSSSTQPGGWQIAVSLLPRQVSTDRGGEIGLKGGEGEAGGWIGWIGIGCSEIQFFSTTTRNTHQPWGKGSLSLPNQMNCWNSFLCLYYKDIGDVWQNFNVWIASIWRKMFNMMFSLAQSSEGRVKI